MRRKNQMKKYKMEEKSSKRSSENRKCRTKKTGRGQLTWISYLYSMRVFLAKLENFFESLGHLITSYPKLTILITLTAVMLSALGLLRMHVEKRTEKLFVPQNSLAEQALNAGKPYFRNFLNVRSEEIIFAAKSRTNVLTKESLTEVSMVLKSIKGIPGYQRLCREIPSFLKMKNSTMFNRNQTCEQLNLMEILTTRNFSQESVFHGISTAMRNKTSLMSNGRTMPVNNGLILAKLQMNNAARTATANAIRAVLFLKRSEEENMSADILDWEQNFVTKLEEFNKKLKHVKLYYSAERSMEDAISKSSTSDIGLISITFTVMCTFACITLAKFVNPVRGHNWLAMSGIMSTALGILSGIGLTMLIGLPFISLVGVVPFLVVSIGIDDMFIIVDEFDRQSKEYEPRRRVSYSLAKVGSTIAMTTITDIIAFLVSATSAFPAVRYFCIYTAICITLEFLLQITMFIAFLTFDAIRIKNSRCDLCPLLVVEDKNSCGVQNEDSMSAKVLNKFAKILLKAPVKALVIAVTLAMCGFGVFGCLNIDTQFNRQSLALKGSHFAEYVNYFEKTFPQNIPVSIQTIGNVNYSDAAIRTKIKEAVSIAYKTGYYESRNFSWIHSFDQFTSRFNIKANGPHFDNALKQFLDNDNYAQHNLDVIRDYNNNIIASRLIVFYKDTSDSEVQKDAMIKFRDALGKQSDVEFTLASDPFIYFEQFAIVIKEVVNNLLMVCLIIVVVLVPFCIHPFIILFILIGFVALVVELFGLMYLWDVQLNSISMINMVMSIGFSVDYSTHIAHAFVTSNHESVNQRIIESLSTVGGSVLLGGTSTFIGMAITGFASSPIFKIFFKMFIGIILFGLYNGLILLPVLLSTFARIVNVRTKYVFKPEDFFTFPLSLLNFSSKKTRKKVSPERKGGVSVMGLSTRFPTAKTKDDFWALLKEGRNTITEYPDDRHARKMHFDEQFHPNRTVAGKIYVSRGSYLEGIAGFDNTFFGITAAEAKMMDPQQRMLLQGAYEAIEDAGMTLEELQQCSTGVYVGIMNQDYNSVTLGKASLPHINQFAATGNAYSMTANRISFSLNLSGPSMAVDTACSSSLTALNIACDHLQNGIVDVAIVGAANLILSPNTQAPICQGNMLASDGKSKVFDEAADGYGRGEGIVVFVLKSSQFVHVTDQPYCELISWGMNNDGKSAAPITAPSSESQKKLMSNVLQEAGVDAKDIQYVEMHGTGTIIGDKVEVMSVGEVYGASREPSNPVIVGSVKSNINHTESTAGLAGLAKVCLMMTHKEYAPLVGIETPAARLGMEQNHLHVQTESSPWPANNHGLQRLAVVNSFGFGGSNAHVIVKELPSTNEKLENESSDESRISPKRVPNESNIMMMTLSASTSEALVVMAKNFAAWLQSVEDTKQNRVDICYTLSERKTAHNIRLIVDASSLKNAARALSDFAASKEMKESNLCSGKVSRSSSQMAFVFGGQGSQWLGMAKGCLKNHHILQTLNSIDKIAKGIGHEQSLLLYLNPEAVVSFEPTLATTQLSIFALQYAVAKFLMNKAGIAPLYVCGHSLGDITAACIANVVDLKSAVKIIRTRAYLQDSSQSTGAMLAIGLEKLAVEEIFERLDVKCNVCIAAENDNNSVTISGDEDAINRIDNHIKEEMDTVFCRRLDTRKAFHSHHMEPMKLKFMKKISEANITPKTAEIRFFSTTEGKELNGNEIGDDYWWRNLRDKVMFKQAVEKMIGSGARALVEISPRPVLSHYMNVIAKQMDIGDINVIQALPARKEPDRLRYLHTQCIGKLHTLGYSVNFGQLQDQTNAKFIRVPSYPWQETNLWANDEFSGSQKTSLLLGTPVTVDAEQICWENEIGLHNFAFLKDHELKTLGPILPGACYIEMAFDAILMDTKIESLVLKDVVFQNTLPLNENSVRSIKCTKVRHAGRALDEFKITLMAEHGEVVLSTAKLKQYRKSGNNNVLTMAKAFKEQTIVKDMIGKDEEAFSEKSLQTDAKNFAQDDCMLQYTRLSKTNKLEDGVYEDFIANTNFVFGEKFCLIESAWSDCKQALVKIKMPAWLQGEMHQYVIHPCIMDACLQTRLVIEATKAGSFQHIIPTGLDEVTLYPINQSFHSLYCFAEIREDASETCEVKLMDNNGNVIMHINGLCVKEYSAFERQMNLEKSIYEVNWKSRQSSEQRFSEDAIFVILGAVKCPWVADVGKALTELHVSDHDKLALQLDEKRDFNEFMDDSLKLISDLSRKGKKMVVINLLPIMSRSIPLKSASSSKAQYLCFESTLTVLKFLNEKGIKKSVVVVLTNKSMAVEDPTDVRTNPWAATSWGMAKVTNLESTIPVICADVYEERSVDICKKALLSVGMKSAESGLVVTSQNVLQPTLERAHLKAKHRVERNICNKDTTFYFSWSDKLDVFFAKKLAKSRQKLPDQHVEIKISHVSSMLGECETILGNVKSQSSPATMQAVVGEVTQVNECETELQAGDHVVGFIQRKWVGNKALVPLQSVLEKPPPCSSETAAVLSGCLLFSHHILTKISSINPDVKSILVVSMPSNRGVCRVIAAIAQKMGINVMTTDGMHAIASPGSRVARLSSYIEQLDKAHAQKSVFDCIVCSSELHPTDNITLNEILVEDGVLAVIDIDENLRMNEYNFDRSVTIINVKPTHASLMIGESPAGITRFQSDLVSVSQTVSPAANTYEVCEICEEGFQPLPMIGKKCFSCINMDVSDKEVPFGSPSMDVQGLKEDRSYIVIGGTKGLGLSTVNWMASRGAGTIVALSRSAAPRDSLQEFENLEAKFGCKIIPLAIDISTQNGVKSLEEALDRLPSIAGAVNSAAVLDDKTFMSIDRESYQKVMASKINCTLSLHELLESRKEEVDFFVLYSSITSVIGNAGQTSYSAANAFLNSFADYRTRSLKKPCTSICWGAMGGAGMLKRNIVVADLLHRSGLNSLDIHTGLQWMEAILTTAPDQANICICDIDWATYFKKSPPKVEQNFLFESLRKELPATQTEEGELFNSIFNAKSLDKQREIVLGFIVQWLAKWIGGNAEEVDCNVPFFTYGVDSIGASVFKAHIFDHLKIDFEVFYFMLPETTATSLSSTLVDTINQKFRSRGQGESERIHQAQFDLIEEDASPVAFRGRQSSRRGTFHSFRSIAPTPEEDRPLILPDNYLSSIYDPPDSKAKLFIVHPSHRYAGIFQGMAAGMKFQELFSVYVFGSPDPGYIGEDIGSVTRLAKACTEMLLKLQPYGPYFLGGYSFGGLVAIEMAAILQKMGKDTAQLIMIDTFHWLPEAKSNHIFLMESFGSFVMNEPVLLEQVRGFLGRIATTQLNMTSRQFDEMAEGMEIDDVAHFLNERAKTYSANLPDMQNILQSTFDDQKMATKYQTQWIPPMNLFNGPVVYIEAESCLCKKSSETGSPSYCFCKSALSTAPDCWSSIFKKKVTTITCPGNHYSIMDQGRAQNVGKVLAVAATLRYRDLFPMVGCISLNANHTTTIAIFKERGMKVYFFQKSALKNSSTCAVLKINKSHSKLKLVANSSRNSTYEIRLKDILNIKTQERGDLMSRKASQLDIHSGYSFLKKDLREAVIMCFTRQDFQRFTHLLEAAYRLKLQ